MYPIAYVQHRLWCDIVDDSGRHQFDGPADVITRTLEQEGIRGFYSGIVPFMLCGFMYRMTFEWAHQLLSASSYDTSTTGYIVAGGTALVAASVITYPFDVIRRRLILNPLSVCLAHARNQDAHRVAIYTDYPLYSSVKTSSIAVGSIVRSAFTVMRAGARSMTASAPPYYSRALRSCRGLLTGS